MPISAGDDKQGFRNQLGKTNSQDSEEHKGASPQKDVAPQYRDQKYGDQILAAVIFCIALCKRRPFFRQVVESKNG